MASPIPIQDKFRNVPDRRRRYQLRQQKKGRCPVCGRKAVSYYCARHAAMKRLRQNALWQKRKLMVKRNGGKV